MLAAARPALLRDAGRRVAALVGAPDKEFRLDDDGSVRWRDAAVARLVRGDDLLRPRVQILRNELLDGAQRERVRARLAVWLDGHIRGRLKALFRLLEADLGSAARGLAFQLSEGLGAMPARAAAGQVAALEKADRRALSRLGVRFGVESIYLGKLLQPAALGLRAQLWAVRHGCAPPRALGPESFPVADGDAPAGFWMIAGYRLAGGQAIRLDRLEALTAALRKWARQGEFIATAELTTLAGCDGEAFTGVLEALGYKARRDESGVTFRAPGRDKARRSGKRRRRKSPAKSDSPFARLRDLVK
jgi:ATP-dependent RNA helicase SUPV3L1/SUV3